MQGTKIECGVTYAVEYAGRLRRYRVSSVTTKRTGKHSADFTHEVEGWLLDPNSENGVATKMTPKDLLGPYEEHAALVAEKEAVKKKQADEGRARVAEAQRLWTRLYELTGNQIPPVHKARNSWESDKYEGDLFPRSYGNKGFEIGIEGVRAIIKALEARR